MRDSFKFMRDIWLFNEKDKGFGFGGAPGGYLRIEVRQGKGKIYAMVQNLREAKPGEYYCLYLLKIEEKDIDSIKIAPITASKGRGELTWEFDPISVGGTNLTITNFNACALVLENERSNNSIIDIQCPIIAYKKEKIRWRDGFSVASMDIAAALRKKHIKNRHNNLSGSGFSNDKKIANVDVPVIEDVPAESEKKALDTESVTSEKPAMNKKLPVTERPSIDEFYSKYSGKVETRYSLYSQDTASDIVDFGMTSLDKIVGHIAKDIDKDNNIDKETNKDVAKKIDEETDKEEKIDKDFGKSKKVKAEDDSRKIENDTSERIQNEEKDNLQEKKEKQDNVIDNSIDKSTDNSIDNSIDNSMGNSVDNSVDNSMRDDINIEFDLGDNYLKSNYSKDDEFLGYTYDEQYIREVLYQKTDNEFHNNTEMNETDSVNESRTVDDVTTTDEETMANEETTVIEESRVKEESTYNGKEYSYDKPKKAPDMIKLIRLLDKEFKRCDPFNSRRRDYKWWSINSPVNLVNILEECRVNVPGFFSPSVVMAYFKYRYIVAGVYVSRRKGRIFFVCGIPGTYNVDESPFGDMCRWVQVERKSRENGAFGYWVTYVDPYTGELLRFS